MLRLLMVAENLINGWIERAIDLMYSDVYFWRNWL